MTKQSSEHWQRRFEEMAKICLVAEEGPAHSIVSFDAKWQEAAAELANTGEIPTPERIMSAMGYVASSATRESSPRD